MPKRIETDDNDANDDTSSNEHASYLIYVSSFFNLVPDSTPGEFRLSINTAQTNMIDAATRTPVTLTQEGDRIVARAGTQIEFDLTINSNSGVITMNLYHRIQGDDPGSMSVSATIIHEEGGDFGSSTIPISFNALFETAQTTPKVRKFTP